MNDLFKGIHEVGVAVQDLQSASELFAAAFQCDAEKPYEDLTPGVEGIFSAIRVGDQRLGLMQDATGSGPIARSIQRRGEGVFNLMIQVSDLAAAMAHLRSVGISFVEPEPRVVRDKDYAGRRYSEQRFAWTHPRTTHGLLIEIQQLKP